MTKLFSKELRAWRAMVARCYCSRHKSYPRYGGRGISVCKSWQLSYEKFLSDVGQAPANHYSLDRYPNPDGDYEPNNVRWATRSQQIINRGSKKTKKQRVPRFRPPDKRGGSPRIKLIDGKNLRSEIFEAAAKHGISVNSIYKRILRGMSPDQALKQPRRKKKVWDKIKKIKSMPIPLDLNSPIHQFRTAKQVSQQTGLHYTTLLNRIRCGKVSAAKIGGFVLMIHQDEAERLINDLNQTMEKPTR
jgi:hypothetical protein